MKTHQLNRLTTQFENLNLSQKEVIERSREANLALITELEEKNKELQNLRGLAKTRVDKLSVVTVSHGQASSKIDRLEEEVDDKNREIAFLKRELEDVKFSYKKSFLNKIFSGKKHYSRAPTDQEI